MPEWSGPEIMSVRSTTSNQATKTKLHGGVQVIPQKKHRHCSAHNIKSKPSKTPRTKCHLQLPFSPWLVSLRWSLQKCSNGACKILLTVPGQKLSAKKSIGTNSQCPACLLQRRILWKTGSQWILRKTHNGQYLYLTQEHIENSQQIILKLAAEHSRTYWKITWACEKLTAEPVKNLQQSLWKTRSGHCWKLAANTVKNLLLTLLKTRSRHC